tara:strand:- start:311 stop:631 length:321 start_codon:yes stop_codon:yes gene_type:complete
MTNQVVQYYLGTYIRNDGQEYQNIILKLSSARKNSVQRAMETFSYYFSKNNYVLSVESKLSYVEYEMLKNHLKIYDHGKIPNKKTNKRRGRKPDIQGQNTGCSTRV